jgi:hypothetical protein
LTVEAFVEAMKSPRVLDKGDVGNGSVLVLEARAKEGKSGYECVRGIAYEKYMPETMLARDQRDIRVVVALEKPGLFRENPGFLPGKPDGVAAPFLIFRWPEKSLLMTGAVRIKGVFEVEPVRRRIASELNGALRGQ